LTQERTHEIEGEADPEKEEDGDGQATTPHEQMNEEKKGKKKSVKEIKEQYLQLKSIPKTKSVKYSIFFLKLGK
jgi:hypothetical protein